jgi:iron-sulfur cluster repair protein YtfE (RIC family)
VSACTAKPLHRLTDELEHDFHDRFRGELALIVDLAAEELARPGSPNGALLRDFHDRAGRLLETVVAHFHREETRLFPTARLAEDGIGQAANRLGSLVLDMRRDHAVIRARLDDIRDLTGAIRTCGVCPLVEMLYGSLAALAEDLERHLNGEEQTLFPYIVAKFFHAATMPA